MVFYLPFIFSCYQKLRPISAVGVGPNILMAKLALRLLKLIMYMDEKRFKMQIIGRFSNVQYAVHKCLKQVNIFGRKQLLV